MTRRLALGLLALALVLAAPPAARAGSYGFSGSLDTGYTRNDVSAGGVTGSVPGWDFGGQLSLNAVPLRADLLQALASVSYRMVESSQPDVRNRTDYLQYGASVSALQASPLTLSGFASRARTNFDATSATTMTGSSMVTSEGGTAYLHIAQVPTVRATLQRSEFDNTGIGGLRTTGRSTQLSTAAAHQLENHAYEAGYDTSWNSGSYGDTNYRTHRVVFNGSSKVTDALEVRLNEQYYLRDPTQQAANSPRFDDNVFGASASWRPAARVVSSLGYGYHHLIADFQGLGENRESTSQSLRAAADWAATPELSWTGSLAGGVNEDRVGTTTLRSAGESAGGGVRWMRNSGASTWQANASGSVGATQLDGQELLAWGAGLGGGWNAALGSWSTSLSASSGYDSNLLGQTGWSLRNQVNASAGTRTPGGTAVRTELQASDVRQHGQLLGQLATQTVQALAGVAFRTQNLTLAAGLTNGAVQGLASPAGSGILPASSNTVSRYATLTAESGLARGLLLTGFARYATVTSPDRPDTWEASFNLRLAYRIGLFDLSLEDRHSIGAQGGPRVTTNVLMARISRSFGASF